MPTTTPNFGWSVPVSTDLVKDGATAIELLGDSIDASLVDLKGGTTGQVLAKASGTDMDFSWVAQDDSNAIQNAIVDAKGDIIAATAADTPARLAVGADNTVLTADSSTATGLKWAAAAGGGKVLQVVSAQITTNATIASTTLTDTNITLSITPTLSTSKVLVLISANAGAYRSAGEAYGKYRIMRGATVIWNATGNDFSYGFEVGGSGANFLRMYQQLGLVYLDSPATTSSTTYKLQAAAYLTTSSGAVRFQADSNPSSITLLEIGA
jgi:hypothetical protein